MEFLVKIFVFFFFVGISFFSQKSMRAGWLERLTAFVCNAKSVAISIFVFLIFLLLFLIVAVSGRTRNFF